MADKRISDLNSAGATLSTDEILLLRSGVNYRTQVGNIGNTATVGSDTEILYNDSGSTGSSANLTYDDNTGYLTVGSGNAGVIIGNSGGVATIWSASVGTPTSANFILKSYFTQSIFNIPAGATGSISYAGTNWLTFGPNTNNQTGLRILANTFGAATTNVGALETAQTWNNANVSFTSFKVAVTDTSSDAASLIADFQLDGNSVVSIGKTGATVAGDLTVTGNLTANIGGGTPGGSNTEVQFNDSGSFGANANFTFDTANSRLTVVGPIRQNVLELLDTGATTNYQVLKFEHISGAQWALRRYNDAANTALATIIRVDNSNSPDSLSFFGSTLISAGVATSDWNALSVTQTWNNANVDFTGIKCTITDTASNTFSYAMQILGSTGGNINLFSVKRGGGIFLPGGNVSSGAIEIGTQGGNNNHIYTNNGALCLGDDQFEIVAIDINYPGTKLRSNGQFSWTNNTTPSTAVPDTALMRNAAGVVEINHGTAGVYANLIVGNLTVASRATIPGLQTIWLPAPAFTARTSNGAASGSTETSTNNVMIETYDFDQTANEYVQFSVAMPKGWDEGNVTAEFHWTADSGSGNVVWGLQGVSISNDDPLDAAFGTAQTVTDDLITAGNLHISSTTSNITIAGTPTEGDLTYFQAYRGATADGLTADARLIGIKLFYTATTLDDT